MTNEKDRWVPHRLMLAGVWNYAYKEYFFEKGNVLFTGPNGGGKTTTLNAAIPFLLDGRYQKGYMTAIKDTGPANEYLGVLLGTNWQQDSTTANQPKDLYVAIEYRRENAESYLTHGIGLKIRTVHAPKTGAGRLFRANFMGFLVPEGAEFRLGEYDAPGVVGFGRIVGSGDDIGYAIHLIDHMAGALARKGAAIRDKDEEYAAMVGETVFQMPELAQFKKYIDHLRRIKFNLVDPKSNQASLAATESVLRAFLPANDSHLVEVAALLERKDKHAKERTKLRQRHDDLTHDHAVQQAYHRHVAHKRAVVLRDESRQASRAKSDWRKAADALAKNEEELRAVELEVEIAEETQAKLGDQLATIDALLAEEDLATQHKDVSEQLGRKNGELAAAKAQRDNMGRRFETLGRQLKATAERRENAGRSLKEKRGQAVAAAEKLSFADKVQELLAVWDGKAADLAELEALDEVARRGDRTLASLDAHLVAAKKVDSAASSAVEAEEALRSIEGRLNIIEKRYNDAQKEVTAKAEGYETATAEYQERLSIWLAGGVQDGWLGKAEAGRAESAADGIPEIGMSYVRMEELLGPALDEIGLGVEEGFGEKRADLTRALHDAQDVQIATKRNLDRAKQEHKVEEARELARPKTSKEAEATFTEISAAGATVVPLYEAVEFFPEVPEATKVAVEAALTGSGLLSALLVDNRSVVPERGEAFVVAPAARAEGETLAAVLTVSLPHDKKALDSMVKEFLASVSLVESAERKGVGGQVEIGRDGSWRTPSGFGVHTVGDVTAFVGLEARRRTRERKLKELEKLICELEYELAECEHIVALAKAKIAEADTWRRAMPVDRALRAAMSHLMAAVASRDEVAGERLKTIEKLAARQNALNSAMAELASCLKPFGYPSPQSSGLVEWVRRWRSDKDSLRSSVTALVDAMSKAMSYARDDESCRREEAQCRTDIQRLTDAVGNLVSDAQRLEKRLKDIEERMNSPEIRDLVSERKKLAEMQREADAAKRKSEDAMRKAENMMQGLRDEEARKKQLNLERAWLRDRAQELWDKAVYLAFPDGEAERRWTWQEAAEKAELAEEPDTNNLRTAGVRERKDWSGMLPDSLGESPEVATKGQVESWATRKEFIVRGQKDAFLADAIYESAVALLEAEAQAEAFDREIIDKLVGDVAVANVAMGIKEATDWGKAIDDLVGARSPKDIRFSFSVTKVERDSANKQVGKILDMMSKMRRLDDASVAEVRAYWHDRLEALRGECAALAAGENSSDIYLAKVKEHLGYQNFIRFEFAYKKEGEPEQRMNATTPIKMSVGQNATCVFLPVFAAVDLMFKDKPNAPRLVGLDETFSGIDEQNCNNLFDLLHEMNVSCILSAYQDNFMLPKVRGLSVYALTNRKGKVYSEHYVWNGRQKLNSAKEPSLLPKLFEERPVNEEDIREARGLGGNLFEETA